MKHIKKYEGFFQTGKNNEKFFTLTTWSKDEVEQLEKLGFEKEPLSDLAPFIYEPIYSEKLKKIIIKKYIIIDKYYYYNLTISLIKGKIIEKDFDFFDKLIEFIKPHIELDIDAKKYNL
jgi:hypothetical protein